MASTTPPIARLGADLLTTLFELLARGSGDHGNAPLLACILCCKKWQPFASAVLYRHVVLDEHRIFKFVKNHLAYEIRSLTVTMAAVGVNPYQVNEAVETTETRLTMLRGLCPAIKEMRPTTLSISVDIPFPFSAASEVASILESLPASCTSLEVDLRHSSRISSKLARVAAQPRPHLCESIRAVLPRLRHLRLRLPTLCPAIFSTSPSQQDVHQTPVHSPKLRTCLINLSLREPRYVNQGAWATTCGDDHSRTPHIGQREQVPSALPPMEETLRDFAHLNKGSLERLWVMDVQPRDSRQYHAHAGWIRRDFLAGASWPIPVWAIGAFQADACVARVPSPNSEDETEDWVSSNESVEIVAEGGSWTKEFSSGARLPTLDPRTYNPTSSPEVMTGAKFRKTKRESCIFWVNEGKTGERILPQGPGQLMQQWELLEITPSGWKRDRYSGSPMVPV
ncbi:hypothetical protein F5Y10DRAFT_258610 [Nemania abortiva]|nr:hypothetical protein F5Y10DRAFT_258610 [Nemania abortiva]